MKRYTDVSRPSDSTDVPSRIKHVASHDERPARPVVMDEGVTVRLRALRTRAEPATPVEAAAALIELSLHESQGPMEDLSDALGRIAQQAQPTEGAADKPVDRAQLARDVAICVESLQFHDRLTQQLTQVRNLLATLAFSDVPESDPHQWLVLLENLRARFTSDSHRILFNLLLPGSGSRSSVASLHANEGSIELF